MEDLKKAWKCLNCSEEIEGQFTFCWNCGHDQAGRLAQPHPATDQEDRIQREFLTNKWRDKNCVECKMRLKYIGKKAFREETISDTLLEDLIFVNHTAMEMYFCPTCLRVEFFLAESG